MLDEAITRKVNRERARAPRLGRIWCIFCDGALVFIGARCGSCGRRNGTRRHKK